MTFEEEFPELKEYQSHSGEYGDYDRGDNVVSCGAVAKHCKSNQRIKEAVMRLPNNNRRHILLKELGLED